MNFADDSQDQATIIHAINDVKNYDILLALTFVTTHTKWSGQLNPWKNLEFLQKGGQFYNPQNKHEIQEVLARNQRQKKKLGLDAASIDATAANQAKPIAI